MDENRRGNRPNRQRRFGKNHRHDEDNNNRIHVAGPSGEGNNNGRKRRTFEAQKPIGYRTLEAVLQTENEMEFICKLSSTTNGFLLLLDQHPIRPEFMCLILAALAKASNSNSEQNTTQALVHLFIAIIPKLKSDSNFHRELKLYIADFSKHCDITSSYRAKHVKAIDDLVKFLRRLQLTTYQRSFDVVRDLMQLITAQISFINRKGNALSESIVETMDQLNESVDKFEETREETEKTEVLLEPPNEFRKIGIYPDAFDILCDHKPFIRKNVVEGKYVGGVDHYLDVQFRLLREDFVRPLRLGITQYRVSKKDPDTMAKTKFRINDLNIYKDVQIYASKMLHNDQVHFCKFDCKPFKNLRWQVNSISNIFCAIFSKFS